MIGKGKKKNYLTIVWKITDNEFKSSNYFFCDMFTSEMKVYPRKLYLKTFGHLRWRQTHSPTQEYCFKNSLLFNACNNEKKKKNTN